MADWPDWVFIAIVFAAPAWIVGIVVWSFWHPGWK